MTKSATNTKYVICIRNDDCDDLEPRKVYATLPDPEAEGEGYVRVVDESGEDYLYPQSYFVPVELSGEVRSALEGC